jgi:hypothetical protein
MIIGEASRQTIFIISLCQVRGISLVNYCYDDISCFYGVLPLPHVLFLIQILVVSCDILDPTINLILNF